MRGVRVTVWVAFFGALLCTAASGQTRFSVKQSAEGLTVHAVDVPLADLVGELARLTGIDVVGAEKLDGLVSVDFADEPLPTAVERLLASVNYILRSRPDPRAPTGQRFVLLVHSMSTGKPSDSAFAGPIHVRSLDAIVADEAADVRDLKDVEEEDLRDDPDEDIYRQEQKLAASTLVTRGDFSPNAQTAVLIELAGNPNEHVRREAVATLASRRAEASVLPALVKALEDEEWDIRTLAVEIIGTLTDSHSLEIVGRLLTARADRDIQISALRVLALRGEPEASVYLRQLPETADKDVAQAARELLEELKGRAQARRAAAR